MRIALYGGFAEKGRTCVGVERAGYRVLLDAGVMTSARGRTDYYPAIGGDNLRAQDAIVLAHAHEDHVAALGFFLANGFRGRIFMTPETARESRAILADYAEAADVALARAATIEPLPVGPNALVLGPLCVTGLAAVGDQVDVRLVHVVGRQLILNHVVHLLGIGDLRRDQANAHRHSLDVPIDRHERHAEREQQHD